MMSDGLWRDSRDIVTTRTLQLDLAAIIKQIMEITEMEKMSKLYFGFKINVATLHLTHLSDLNTHGFKNYLFVCFRNELNRQQLSSVATQRESLTGGDDVTDAWWPLSPDLERCLLWWWWGWPDPWWLASVSVSIIFRRLCNIYRHSAARPGSCCHRLLYVNSSELRLSEWRRVWESSQGEPSDFYWHLSCHYWTFDKIIQWHYLKQASDQQSSGINSYFSLTSQVQFTFINKDIKITSRRYLSIYLQCYICFRLKRSLDVSFPWELRCVS